jgi:membrane fusion protein (multidrug efflux system)
MSTPRPGTHAHPKVIGAQRRRGQALTATSRLRRRPDWFLLAVMVAVMAVVLSGCDVGQAPEQSAEPPSVGVIEVGESAINPFFEFVGKTRAVETVALRARVLGFLELRDFQEGAMVEAGQVLFEIEPEQYEATLDQAEAALAAAEASLNRAQVDLARYQELAKTQNVSQQKVDEAEAEVLVQQAAVETAKADVDKTALNLNYTKIVAPISGRIDRSAFDVGNLVGPESGVLATINKMDPINVTFTIAETWYLELVQADKAAREDGEASVESEEFAHVPLIRLSDGSLYEHEGIFDFIDNKVDEATGTVLVRAQFPNPDDLLLPGQFVTVVIERKDAIEAVTVPQAAVLTDQGGRYVLVVDDQKRVEARRIETGQEFGPNLLVKSGLGAGERVVLYGIQKVRPGIEVKPELTAAPQVDAEGRASGTPASAPARQGSEAGPAVEPVVEGDVADADANSGDQGSGSSGPAGADSGDEESGDSGPAAAAAGGGDAGEAEPGTIDAADAGSGDADSGGAKQADSGTSEMGRGDVGSDEGSHGDPGDPASSAED